MNVLALDEKTVRERGHEWRVPAGQFHYEPCCHCGSAHPYDKLGQDTCSGNPAEVLRAQSDFRLQAEREAAQRNADRLAALEERKVVAMERIADALTSLVREKLP